eukprot:2493972-Amphidinium_carterae.1
MPAWLRAKALFISSNYLSGSIADQVFANQDQGQMSLVANELVLQGTFPASASRIQNQTIKDRGITHICLAEIPNLTPSDQK